MSLAKQLSFVDGPPDLSAHGLVTEGNAQSWAAFSPDKQYRYLLGRSWGGDAVLRLVVYVMLNPSTATGGGPKEDDPTIRRCIGFARREGLNGLLVVNLFGWRSTKPGGLLVPSDPIGPKNIEMVRWALTHVHQVRAVAAWGRFPSKGIERLAARQKELLRTTVLPAGHFVELECFGLTDVEPRQPRHPLMLPGNTLLERWQ